VLFYACITFLSFILVVADVHSLCSVSRHVLCFGLLLNVSHIMLLATASCVFSLSMVGYIVSILNIVHTSHNAINDIITPMQCVSFSTVTSPIVSFAYFAPQLVQIH